MTHFKQMEHLLKEMKLEIEIDKNTISMIDNEGITAKLLFNDDGSFSKKGYYTKTKEMLLEKIKIDFKKRGTEIDIFSNFPLRTELEEVLVVFNNFLEDANIKGSFYLIWERLDSNENFIGFNRLYFLNEEKTLAMEVDTPYNDESLEKMIDKMIDYREGNVLLKDLILRPLKKDNPSFNLVNQYHGVYIS